MKTVTVYAVPRGNVFPPTAGTQFRVQFRVLEDKYARCLKTRQFQRR